MPGDELADDCLAVGFRNVRLDESAAELPEIIDDEVHRGVVDVPKKWPTGHGATLTRTVTAGPPTRGYILPDAAAHS